MPSIYYPNASYGMMAGKRMQYVIAKDRRQSEKKIAKNNNNTEAIFRLKII